MPTHFNPVMGPPISRQGSAVEATKRNPIDNLLDNPFLLNLLAQSGFSPVPQSPFGAIGRAALGAQQFGRQREQDALRQQLIESQIGLNQFRATPGGLNPTAGNVQSTFEGDNGNMFIITRDGRTVDTGIKFSNNLQLVEQADGTVVAIDRRTAEQVGTPVTPSEAAGATTRKAQTEAAQELPVDLAGIDAAIQKSDETIDKVNRVLPLVKPNTVGIESAVRGDLPGFLGGEARQLKRAVESLQANFGFDTLNQMRQASKTGGALGQVSERELALLINALEAIDLEGDPDTLKENLNLVVRHYENYKKNLEKIKDAKRQQAGQKPDTSKPISEMTDAELEAIASDSNP